MKRVFTAGLLALSIHGLLLGLDCKWFKPKISFDGLKPYTMDITLIAQQPRVATPKPIVKYPRITTKKNVSAKKNNKKPTPKHPFEPRPQKIVKTPSQPAPKEILKPISKTTAHPSDSSMKPVQTEIVTPSKKNDVKSVHVPENGIIHEAKPLYKNNPPPKYPKMARRRGLQGMVVLEVLVDKNGDVAELRVLSSSGHYILDKAAAAGVRNWTFDPAIRAGNKVKMWVRVPIRFELK